MLLRTLKVSTISVISFVIFLLFFCTIFGFLRYQQSSILKTQADELIKQGKPSEAIILYNQAHAIFPLRQDVIEDAWAAELILESDLEYGQIYQIGEKIQEQPSLVRGLPPAQPLKPNELLVPILMYHHIRINPHPSDPVWAALNVDPMQLENQLQYLLAHNFHTITLDELSKALNGETTLPANPIILTFDDGYSSFYDAVFPLLTKYRVKAVQFVITGVVGSSPYLSWSEILQMDKSGLVQWGGHTRHHPNLPNISPALITDEIKGSKDDLEKHLQKQITWFAYPYGSYSDFIIKTVREVGFAGAVSTIYGALQSKDKIYLLPRIMIDGRFSLTDFINRLRR